MPEESDCKKQPEKYKDKSNGSNELLDRSCKTTSREVMLVTCL